MIGYLKNLLKTNLEKYIIRNHYNKQEEIILNLMISN